MENELNMPTHIAIIMDGNRRWAKNNNLEISLGHKKGAENLENITKYCNEIGIKYLTVYAFSTENWKRSKEEVGALMKLLQAYLENFMKRSDASNVKIQIIGDRSNLSLPIKKGIEAVENKTKNNTGTVLNIAFNYGGRDEIVKAVKNIALNVKENNIDIENINEELISNNLYTKNIPDPDLMIRTSGELRTSNFLPWQLVYSEFYFSEKYWPEFTRQDLDKAIEEYNRRNRKFGGK